MWFLWLTKISLSFCHDGLGLEMVKWPCMPSPPAASEITAKGFSAYVIKEHNTHLHLSLLWCICPDWSQQETVPNLRVAGRMRLGLCWLMTGASFYNCLRQIKVQNNLVCYLFSCFFLRFGRLDQCQWEKFEIAYFNKFKMSVNEEVTKHVIFKSECKLCSLSQCTLNAA